MKAIKRRAKRRLKEYTYLGCPLTRNRSPWCFRLCVPNAQKVGRCGRIAPHSIKSRYQISIENYDKEYKRTSRNFNRLEKNENKN